MIDFDKIIASCLSEGMKPEDIADQVTTALNKAKTDPKEDWLDALYTRVNEAISDGCLSIEDCVAGIVLQLSTEHKDWPLETLKTVYQSIEDNIHTATVLADAEIDGTLEKTALALIEDAIKNGLTTSIKASDIPEAKTKVTVKKVNTDDMDGEAITRFLKSIMEN